MMRTACMSSCVRLRSDYLSPETCRDVSGWCGVVGADVCGESKAWVKAGREGVVLPPVWARESTYMGGRKREEVGVALHGGAARRGRGLT